MKRSRLINLMALFAPVTLIAGLYSPSVKQITANGVEVWNEDSTGPAQVGAGEILTIEGEDFGDGVEADFSKILFGNVRAIERDLCMYRGAIDRRNELYYEKADCFDRWLSDVLSWSPRKIRVRVPVTASKGPLVISVQKRIGNLASLLNPSQWFIVLDPLTTRIPKFTHLPGTVSLLGDRIESNAVPLVIANPDFNERVRRGEAIYWAFDFNIGLVHKLRGLDWEKILNKKAINPMTGKVAIPEQLFGAIPVREGELPDVATKPYFFDPFPAVMPIRSPLRPALIKGWTYPSGYIGRVYAEAINPYTQLKGAWAGENCASCHARRIKFQNENGDQKTKVFVGIPNPHWTEKWTILGNFTGVKGVETQPDGRKLTVDKSQILYHVPWAATENALVRQAYDGSQYSNDNLFAPVVIPTITRHTPLRRALSRTEMIVGFEGSYIHSEEPDGAIGAMRSSALQDLTCYMSVLDADDEILSRLALYRWLNSQNLGYEIDSASEGEFLKNGPSHYPTLLGHLERGKASFVKSCQNCHDPNFGTWTDERMFGFTEVGTYFSPSVFHREVQSIRTSYLRNLYWVQDRGLLHDGHVKNMKDLVHPDRCTEGSPLYQSYYALSSKSFHIPKGNKEQERTLRNHAYFVDVDWDKNHLYWDYQKMRREFGPREFGLSSPVLLPHSPHPWCAQSASEVDDLVVFLMSL